MKKILFLHAIILGSLANTIAQDKINITKENTDQNSISIGNNGLEIGKTKNDEKRVKLKYGGLDLGLNMLIHGTDYTSTNTQSFLNVPNQMKNDNLFSLRQGNSWNVNVWLLMLKVKLVDQSNFRMNLNSALGMQIYNFKYQKNILHLNETNPEIILDEQRNYEKNKLSIMYGSIPLKLNFHHRISSMNYFQYSFGVIGGVNASTWTKSITRQDGKEKNHDQFNLAPFNLNLVGEIGLTNSVTLYATYQISNMYKSAETNMNNNALIQNPLSIGIKLTGF